MAGQVITRDLGLELFRIDLATVVSKYIQETEKNLDRIFEAATGSNAILFFDEADALFGKRSEVRDAHDRYANIEVAYLLQKMESYPGAVILATNFRQNMDDGFLQRLDFVIDFPFPEAEDRERIWRLLLPEAAPIDQDVDVHFLATQFKLAGGGIETPPRRGLPRGRGRREDRDGSPRQRRGAGVREARAADRRVRLRTLPRAHQATERRPRKRPGVKRREHLPRGARRAAPGAGADATAGVQKLQQTAGNRAVAGLIQRQRSSRYRLLEGGLTLDPELEAMMRRLGKPKPDLFDPKVLEGVAERGRHPDWTPLPEHAPRSRSPLVPRGEGPAEPRSGLATSGMR